MKAKSIDKLTPKDIARIRARYESKFEEFSKLSLDELQEIFKNKMSRTDRDALVNTATIKLKELESSIKEDKTEQDGEGTE